MMSVSVEVSTKWKQKEFFWITPFEPIKNRLLETILKLQNFRFFLPEQGLEPETSRTEIRRAANWARRFW